MSSRRERRWRRQYWRLHWPLCMAVGRWCEDMPFEEMDDFAHLTAMLSHAPYRGVMDRETVLRVLSYERSGYEAAVRLQQVVSSGFLFRTEAGDFRAPMIDAYLERCRFAEIAHGHDFTRTRWAQ